MTTLYVAGPMSGYADWNFPAFFLAAASLREAGYDVVNPARRGVVEGKPWEEYLKEALVDLVGCDGVVVLPGWQESRGACLEVHVARALSMPVAEFRVWMIKAQKDEEGVA